MSNKIKAIIGGSIAIVLLVAALLALKFTAPPKDPNDLVIPDDKLVSLIEEDRYKSEYLKIKNNSGEFELKLLGENLYTVVGFEDLPQISNVFTTVFSEVCNVVASEIIEENCDDLGKFGLADPEVQFEYKVKDKEPYKISIGNLSSDGSIHYVCETGKNTVYAFSATAMSSLYKSKYDYLNKEIIASFDGQVAAEVPIINRISIKRPDLEKPMIFETMGKDDLTENSVPQSSIIMTSPVKSLISETPAQDYFYGNFGLTADDVACVNPTPEQLTEYGFDNPSSEFEIDYNDNLTVRIKTGNGIPCEHEEGEDLTGHKHVNTHHYAISKEGNIVYEIKTEAMRWFEMQPKDIISIFAVIPSIFDIDRLEFVIDDVAHVLKYTIDEREDGTKSVEGATLDGKEVDSEHARGMYQLLASTSIIDLNTVVPTVKPTTTVKYVYKNGKVDTVEMFVLPDRTGVVSFNGNNAFKSRVGINDKIIKEFDNLVNGKAVDTSW